jgi:hypothetical protein
MWTSIMASVGAVSSLTVYHPVQPLIESLSELVAQIAQIIIVNKAQNRAPPQELPLCVAGVQKAAGTNPCGGGCWRMRVVDGAGAVEPERRLLCRHTGAGGQVTGAGLSPLSSLSSLLFSLLLSHRS